MATRERAENDKVFLKIVDGTLRQSVPEGTQNAVMREWQAGGKTGVLWELIDKAVRGRIVDVSFYEGEHDGKKFQSLNVTLDREDENDKYVVITTGIDTRYAQDILKKLPNVDFGEEVRIRPYSYIPNGKEKASTGVELTQQDAVTGQFTKKIESFFDGYEKDKKQFFGKNGFPMPEGDTHEYDSDDWKSYFIRVKKFLVTYTRQHIIPKFAKGAAVEAPTSTEGRNTEPDPDAMDRALEEGYRGGPAYHPDQG
jgi:hypothetical protein